MLTRAAVEWLEDRGLDPDLAARYHWESRNPVGVSEGEWLAAPFEREGEAEPLNWKYRRIDGPKQFLKDKGKPPSLWNEAVLTDPGLKDQPLVITEGLEDALAIIQAGHWRTVSVPDGAPNKPAKDPEDRTRYAWLVEAIEEGKFESVERVILATDNDKAGWALQYDLSQILGLARCKRLEYPEGCKDTNDVLVRFGRRAVSGLIDNAKWVDVPGVRRLLSDYPASAEQDPLVWRVNLSTDFQRHVGIMPGFISAWTGIPGHGKTQLLKQVTWRLCEQYNIRAAVASFEESFPRDYRRHFRQYKIGRPRNSPQREDWTPSEMANADAWLDENIVALDPHAYNGQDEIDVTLDWCIEATIAAVVRHGVRFAVWDPWGEIEQDRAGNETEHDYTGRALMRANRLARMFGIHVAIVAHPRKLDSSREGIKKPGPYDISGSSHWFNKVSLGASVHKNPERDDDNKPLSNSTRTEVDIWKSKFQDVQGPTGSLFLEFSRAKGRYLPMQSKARRADDTPGFDNFDTR